MKIVEMMIFFKLRLPTYIGIQTIIIYYNAQFSITIDLEVYGDFKMNKYQI